MFYFVSMQDVGATAPMRQYRIQATSDRVAAWCCFCHYVSKELGLEVEPLLKKLHGRDGWSEVRSWFLDPEQGYSIVEALDAQDILGTVVPVCKVETVKNEYDKV